MTSPAIAAADPRRPRLEPPAPLSYRSLARYYLTRRSAVRLAWASLGRARCTSSTRRRRPSVRSHERQRQKVQAARISGRASKPRATAPKPQQPQGPRERPEGPKTPNLMASHEVFRCSRCGNRLALPVSADGRCTRCGVDLHSCIQCLSFDTGARFECTQPLTARVAPKDARNECASSPRGPPSSARPARRVRQPRGRRSTICSSRVYRPSA